VQIKLNYDFEEIVKRDKAAVYLIKLHPDKKKN
jgi:hypothetical protein